MIRRVPENTFVSYAQNREDVVLWRALHQVQGGRYVEVGANHPTDDSISRAFYDRGWRGVTVEPVPRFAELHRAERPEDTQVEAAVTSRDVEDVTLHVVGGTGLSSLRDDVGAQHTREGWDVQDIQVPARSLDSILSAELAPGQEIHFMVVDVEGAEREVLESVDLRRWRPWVLVVEATAPSSPKAEVALARRTHHEWEELVLQAGYRFCLFDGLSRFYVADEHADELSEALTYPAGPLDFFVTHEQVTLRAEIDRLERVRTDLLQQAVHWRTQALTQWAGALSVAAEPAADSDGAARAELEAMRRTLSWRITRPIRVVRRVAGRARRALR